MVLEPAAEHVAGVVDTNGVTGADNIAALLNEADADEVQLPILAVTV